MQNSVHRTDCLKLAVASIIIAAVCGAVLLLSAFDYKFAEPSEAMLKIAIKHPARRLVECNEAELLKKAAGKYKEELAKTGKASMRLETTSCGRERHDLFVEVKVDGNTALRGLYKASGIKKDGNAYVYARIPLKPGTHKVEALLGETGNPDDIGTAALFPATEIGAGRVVILGYDANNGGFYFK